MENTDYLNQIAAKPTPTSPVSGITNIVSPKLIKLVAGAIIAFILMLVIGNILGSANSKTTALNESFYLRVQNLSAANSPLTAYARDLHSSDLRALTNTLKTSLLVTAQNLNLILSDLNIDPANIDEQVTLDENANIADLSLPLQSARLNGLLDRTFANSINLQVTLLISKGYEILDKNSTPAVQATLTKALADLDILSQRFTDLANTID